MFSLPQRRGSVPCFFPPSGVKLTPPPISVLDTPRPAYNLAEYAAGDRPGRGHATFRARGLRAEMAARTRALVAGPLFPPPTPLFPLPFLPPPLWSFSG